LKSNTKQIKAAAAEIIASTFRTTKDSMLIPKIARIDLVIKNKLSVSIPAKPILPDLYQVKFL